MERATPPTLAQQHQGLIIHIAQRFWPSFPLRVKASYDFDDLVQDLNGFLLQQSHRFRTSRAAPSTFVYIVLENRCRDILRQHHRMKREMDLVSLDQMLEQGAFFCREDEERHLRESRMAVETIIRFASDPLRDLLGDLLGLRHYSFQRHIKQTALHSEARRLAVTHHVSPDDFRAILRRLV